MMCISICEFAWQSLCEWQQPLDPYLICFVPLEPGLRRDLPSSHKVLFDLQWQQFFSLLRPISKCSSSAVCLCSPRLLSNILWYIFCLHLSIKCTILDTESSRCCGIGVVTSYSSHCTFKPLSVYFKQHGFSQSGPAAYICTLETEQQTSMPEATSTTPAQKKVFSHSAFIVWILSNTFRIY